MYKIQFLGSSFWKHLFNHVTALSYERNEVKSLFKRRELDIGFHFGNEVLELEGGIVIILKKVRKTVENIGVDEGIERRRPGAF